VVAADVQQYPVYEQVECQTVRIAGGNFRVGVGIVKLGISCNDAKVGRPSYGFPPGLAVENVLRLTRTFSALSSGGEDAT
jgi:hypothetical protein